MTTFKPRYKEKKKSKLERLHRKLSSGFYVALNLRLLKPKDDFYFHPRTHKAWVKYFHDEQKRTRINFMRLYRADIAVNICACGVLPWCPRTNRYHAKYVTRRNVKLLYHHVEYWQKIDKERKEKKQ